MHNLAKTIIAVTAAGILGACATSGTQKSATEVPKLGKPISEQTVALWNIDIRTKDGLGLPGGSGTVAQGKVVYEKQCASCHGPDAKGGPVFGTMVGGIGSMTQNPRILTPGSMYPYAAILFDYTRRAMPMNAPQSLTNNEVYAVTAYIYNLNGLIPNDAVVDAKYLTAMKMPNRDAFIQDTRPDVKAERCMSNCKPVNSKL
jgi:S-disulfanyl-L-cysteine oxidoreductase SoxD